jgi:hypothetical protein
MWVWSRGAGYDGADVVGGCKELSAGLYVALALCDLPARILYSRRRLEKHALRRRVQQFVGQKCKKLIFAGSTNSEMKIMLILYYCKFGRN